MEENMGRVVDTYRARMTTHLAMSLAMVTVTGYALKEKAPDLLLAAAGIPALILFTDVLFKTTIAGPFLYKALMADRANPESEALLFLDFRCGENSRFAEIRAMSDASARRKRFRWAYLRRGLGWKVVLLGVASSAEVYLYVKLVAVTST